MPAKVYAHVLHFDKQFFAPHFYTAQILRTGYSKRLSYGSTLNHINAKYLQQTVPPCRNIKIKNRSYESIVLFRKKSSMYILMDCLVLRVIRKIRKWILFPKTAERSGWYTTFLNPKCTPTELAVLHKYEVSRSIDIVYYVPDHLSLFLKYLNNHCGDL